MKTIPALLRDCVLLTGMVAATACGEPMPEIIQRPARLFPLDEVRLLDPALLKMRTQMLAYLRALDSERLLYHFRVSAGVPTDAEPLSRRQRDHEAPTSPFRGHFTGHFLSASAMMFAGTLETRTQESCNTYNMLKLTEHLFTWAPDAKHADFYERAFLNHILGTPHPDTGMPLYHLGLKPGQWKCVFARNDSFWCCAGTGLENFAKLQRGFYFQGDRELWVNQFFASEVDWRAQGVTLRQETRFPDEPGTTLIVKATQPGASIMAPNIRPISAHSAFISSCSASVMYPQS